MSGVLKYNKSQQTCLKRTVYHKIFTNKNRWLNGEAEIIALLVKSTTSLSISIFLIVEQSALLKQFTSLTSLHNSLLYVASDSTLLHVPFPMADTALMRTSYTVPASRASRRVDVVEPGETGLTALQLVPLLYSTWY